MFPRCHHVRFDSRLMSVIENTPGSGRMFVSIVRRPSERFRSAWHWYKHGADDASIDHSANFNTSIKSFVHRLATMEGITSMDEIRDQFKYRTGLDATSVELVGSTIKAANFEHEFTQIIQNIQSLNYVILVANRMEESLVALAIDLKWPLSDMLYYSLKVRDVSKDRKELDTLSKHEMDTLDR